MKGGKKTKRTEEEVGRQHQGMDRPGACQVTEGSGEQGKNGGNWSRKNLWCPNDPRGQGIDNEDDDDDDDDDEIAVLLQLEPAFIFQLFFAFLMNLVHTFF